MKKEMLYATAHRTLRGCSKHFLLLLLTLAMSVLLSSTSARADALNLVPSRPDITGNPLNISYNASTRAINISGNSSSFFTYNGGNLLNAAITNATYALTGTINSAGALTGGMLTITGTLADAGINSTSTLLTGTLTNFGFTSSGTAGLFEFTFDNTGGDSRLGFGPLGGVIFTTTSLPANFNFATSFSNIVGRGDTFAANNPVPEPASIVLLTLGGLGMAAKRRRRKTA